MSDTRTLIFEPSQGVRPDPESIAGQLFRVCCDADQETLSALCAVPMSDLEEAIGELQSLGWQFKLVSLQ